MSEKDIYLSEYCRECTEQWIKLGSPPNCLKCNRYKKEKIYTGGKE